jgi:hypothetical protein
MGVSRPVHYTTPEIAPGAQRGQDEQERHRQQPDHSAVEHGRFRTAKAGDLAGYPTPGTKGEEGAYHGEERCPEAEVTHPHHPSWRDQLMGAQGHPIKPMISAVARAASAPTQIAFQATGQATQGS